MTAIDLITRTDFEQFKIELFEELKKIGINTVGDQSENQWLKSSEVRKLLKISPGTLQNLRVNGILPYTKVGSMFYYRQNDIEKILNGNHSNP
jgi:hypothetical protein